MTEPLRNRLVRAVVEAIRDDDPVVTVAVGENELRVGWLLPDRPQYCNRCGIPHGSGECRRPTNRKE